jgi:lipoyl(octanoyl) transferase
VRALEVHRLGRVAYADGLDLMRSAAERLRAGSAAEPDRLLLLEHPPVLTIGRGGARAHVVASPQELARRGLELHEVDRGGDVTWHGPGQVVGYPVVDLRARPDVRRFVGDLEEAMILTCADFGVEAGRHPLHRGAWVATRKIGAVGVRLDRWISGHGLALNVDPDLAAFDTIVPCGIADPRLGVTSLAAELAARGRRAPDREAVEERLAHHLARLLDRLRVAGARDLRALRRRLGDPHPSSTSSTVSRR